MKRLFQLALLLSALAWCVPASAQISFVGGGAIGGATTTTDATAALPASTLANDILFVDCWVRSTADTTVVSGYTAVEANIDTGTGSHSLFWKRHDGSEGTATCNKSASADSYARQYAFRGVIQTGDPWNASVAFQVDNGTTDPTTFTGITTGAASSMVVIFDGYEDDDASVAVVTSTDPAAYTENYAESTTGADGSMEISYALRTAAGAIGNVSIAYGTIATRSDDTAVKILSLAPQPANPSTHFVGCWGTGEQAGSATTVTVSVSPTGGTGHALIAFARSGGSTLTSIVLSDNSGSNTWGMFGSLLIPSDDLGAAQSGGAHDVAGGTYTVTATYNPTITFRSITVCELDDMASASILDTMAECFVPETSQDDVCTTGAFTTTNANDTILTMATVTCTSCTQSVGPVGANTPEQVSSGVANNMGVHHTEFSSTQSSITSTMNSSTNNGWMMVALALKHAAGGGGRGAAPQQMLLGVGD